MNKSFVMPPRLPLNPEMASWQTPQQSRSATSTSPVLGVFDVSLGARRAASALVVWQGEHLHFRD